MPPADRFILRVFTALSFRFAGYIAVIFVVFNTVLRRDAQQRSCPLLPPPRRGREVHPAVVVRFRSATLSEERD